MAVPTLTSIAPTTSRTGGRVLARLVGTGFRLPSPPPALGRAPALAPSLDVRFGGTAAETAFAVSATEAYALVPSRAAGVVSVSVQNLDDAGAAISGEVATLAAAFTYKMPDLAREGPIAIVVRALLQALKREVLDNVALTTHTEYDPTTGDQLSVIDVATLPAIILVGPRLPTSRPYARNQPRVIPGDGGVFYRLRPSVTVDLAFTLTSATDSAVQMQNLAGEVMAFFQRSPYLRVPDAAQGSVRYEMQAEFAGLETAARPSESNVRQFSGDLVIRGVDVDEEDMRVAVSRPVVDYVPDGAPTYTEQEASRVPPWPAILGSSANGAVTATDTPEDGVDFEQIPPGDEP